PSLPVAALGGPKRAVALAAALSRREPCGFGTTGSSCEPRRSDPAESLGAVDDERRQTFGSSPRSIILSINACRTVAFGIDPERGDEHQIVADVQAVDLDHQQVQLRQVRRLPLG